MRELIQDMEHVLPYAGELLMKGSIDHANEYIRDFAEELPQSERLFLSGYCICWLQHFQGGEAFKKALEGILPQVLFGPGIAALIQFLFDDKNALYRAVSEAFQEKPASKRPRKKLPPR